MAFIAWDLLDCNNTYRYYDFLYIFNVYNFTYLLDNFIYQADVAIDDEYVYLDKFFISKKIPLTKIKHISQRRGLKRNYEPLIVLKVSGQNLLFKKVYIIPDNYSYRGKVKEHKIYKLTKEKIEKAKMNKNAC